METRSGKVYTSAPQSPVKPGIQTRSGKAYANVPKTTVNHKKQPQMSNKDLSGKSAQTAGKASSWFGTVGCLVSSFAIGVVAGKIAEKTMENNTVSYVMDKAADKAADVVLGVYGKTSTLCGKAAGWFGSKFSKTDKNTGTEISISNNANEVKNTNSRNGLPQLDGAHVHTSSKTTNVSKSKKDYKKDKVEKTRGSKNNTSKARRVERSKNA